MRERGSLWKHVVDYWLGIPLVWLTTCFRVGYTKRVPHHPKRIGVLCLGALGDLLLVSSLINCLRRVFPQASFTLITSKSNAGVAPLVGVHHVAFGLSQIFRLIHYVRQQKFDLFFDSSQWARIGALVSNCSKAQCTVGFRTKGQMRHFGYTYAVPHSAEVHECANFLALAHVVAPECTSTPSLTLPPPCLRPNAPAPLVKAWKDQNAIYLHMWPSGVHATCKEWPAELWAELVAELEARAFSLYLTGSLDDAEKNKNFLRAYPSTAVSLAGIPTLVELATLFTKAQAVVSVNTGIMHLAALAGAPTVGLHGPTNPRRWGPVGKHVCALLPRQGRCAYLNLGFEYSPPYENTLAFLPVADVLDALFTRLAVRTKAFGHA